MLLADLLVEGALSYLEIEVQCVSFSSNVWVGGGGGGGGGLGSVCGGLGGGGESYQPGVYVPLKALFLVNKRFLPFNTN